MCHATVVGVSYNSGRCVIQQWWVCLQQWWVCLQQWWVGNSGRCVMQQWWVCHTTVVGVSYNSGGCVCDSGGCVMQQYNNLHTIFARVHALYVYTMCICMRICVWVHERTVQGQC